jgi:hypothetical protein
MSSVLDIVMQQIQGGGITQMSRSLGLGEDDVTKVVSGAIPALMGSLIRNSASSGGAESLLGALDRDHDGSILDDVTGFLGQSGSVDAGAGILRHALGAKQPTVETALSRSTGVDSASAGKILAMVAPILMGALGKAKRQQGLDVSGLSSLLGQEEEIARKRSPEAVDMVARVLDSDGDGDVMDDVAKLGTSLLGSLFKK